jgi:membrane protease YdiL (CAAX protease family)
MKESMVYPGSNSQGAATPWRFLERHALPLGIVLMFLFTWPIGLVLAAESRDLVSFSIPLPIAVLVGYGFVLATLLMTGLLRGKGGIVALLRRYLIWRVGIGWYLVVLVMPALIYLAAIAVYILLEGQSPNFSNTMARQIFGSGISLWLVFPFLFFDMLTNGEEIGWRGYVLPRLQWRQSALISSFILGVIWAAWHIPKFLVVGNPTPFGWYVGMTIARAILFTWVYNNTIGSLLMVTILHAAYNTAYVFLPLAPQVTGEPEMFKIAVVIECVVAIIVVLVFGSENLSRRYPAQFETPETELSTPSSNFDLKIPWKTH